MKTKHKILKKHLKNTLVISIAMLLSWSSEASHIIGGEITYRCLGGNEFEVTLDVFRDCYYGIPNFDDPAAVAIYNEDGAVVELELSPIFIDSLPTDLMDPCLEVPSDVCVDWARYQSIVTLLPDMVKTEGFTIVYQRCCRNNTISNIVNPDSTGATYFVEITPQSYYECNSSPTFTQSDTTYTYPPVFVCVGKPIIYDHSASDIDGDSLAYKLCTPYLGASYGFSQPPLPNPPPYENITWNAPFYGVNNMLGSNPPLQIDVETGLLTGFPTIMGQFVVGVCVEEYRNGVLLSTVRRDFQYNVGMCLELIADFEAPEAQCDNLTVQFENKSNIGTNFVWYPQFPQMDIVSTSTNLIHTFPDTGSYTVCLINEPFSQCADTICKPLFLQFNSIEADFSFSTFDCADSSVVVLQDLSNDSVSPIIEWNWEIEYDGIIQTSSIQSPTFVVPNPSVGSVTLMVRSENGCERTKIGTFQTNQNNPTSQISPFVQICKGESVELNPNLIGLNDFTFTWDTPIGSSEINPMVAPDTTTTYTVTISAFNDLCSTDFEVTVQVLELPILDFEFSSACDGVTLDFTNFSQNAFAYIWDFGDGSLPSNAYFPTHTFPDTGSYTITLMTAPFNMCHDTLVRDIFIDDKVLIPDFHYEYVTCETDEVTLQFLDNSTNSLNNTTVYSWSFENIGASIDQNPIITIGAEQAFDVTLTLITSQGCNAAITRNVAVDFIEYDFPDSVKVCWNETMELNPTGNPNYQYLWTPAEGLDDNTKPNPIANPEETTVYTVQIKNVSADTCEIMRNVIVYVPERIDLNAGDNILTCDETLTLNATTSISNVVFNWENEQQNSIGSLSSIVVSVSGTNVYYIEASDDFNCRETDEISVSGGPINIDLAGDQIKCTDEPVNIFVTNLDPNDDLTINWSPTDAFVNNPTDNPNPELKIAPGEQMIYVDVENQFGCTLEDSVYIALINSNINLDFDFQVGCSGATVEFFNTSTDAFNYVWDFGTGDTSILENPIYTFPDTGHYMVTLNIGFDVNCVAVMQKEVEILSPDFIPDFTFEYDSCSTETIFVQFYDNSFNFLNNTSSWSWTFSNGQTSDVPNPLIAITENTSLSATLEISTPNNCSGQTTQVLEIELTQENLEDELILCFGDSTTLNPNGIFTYDYIWSPETGLNNSTEANPTVFTTETINYQVTITNISADTCAIEREVLVTIPEVFEIFASGDTTTCGNETLLMANSTLDPAINFEWQNTNGDNLQNGNSILLNPEEEITVILEGTDENMCFDRDTFTVFNEAINLDINFKGEACPKDTIQILASNGIPEHTLSITWEAIPPAEIIGSDTGSAITAITAPAGQNALFVITAINQFDCTTIDTVTIFSHPFFPTFESEVLACPFIPTPLNPDANPALNYSWFPPDLVSDPITPNPTASLGQTTNLTVLISETFDLDVCELYADVFVEIPTIIDIEESVDTFTCGAPILICAELNVPVNIQWTDSEGTILEGDDCIEVNPSVSDFYIISVEDQFECSANDTVFVSNEAVNISIIGDGEISSCPQDSLLISVTNLDSNDNLSYEWLAISNGTIINNGDTNQPTVSTVPNTFATFEVIATNQFGCQVTDNVIIQTYEFNAAVDDTIRICAGIPTELNPNFTEGLVYQWSPAEFLENPNSPNPIATINETILFEVTIMGVNLLDTCMATLQVLALVNPPINLNTVPEEEALCEFMETTIIANAATIVDFEWSNNSIFTDIIGEESQVIVNPMGESIYYVRAIDDLGCIEIDTVIIHAFPIDVTLDDIHNFCIEKETVEIEIINNDPTQNLTFEWSPSEFIQVGNVNSNPIEVAVANDAWLFANIENQYGCQITDSTFIQFFDLNAQFGSITAAPDTLVFGSGQSSQLNIDDFQDIFYDWTPSDGLDFTDIPNPMAIPEETTVYTVELFNEEGCLTTRDIEIFVKNPTCNEPFIFIPSGFSPNGDGENDVLYVHGISLDEVELVIFNRWGQEVFKTNDPTIGWNGTFKGEFLSPDVYGYYLKVTCFNGEEYFKKGNISLLR